MTTDRDERRFQTAKETWNRLCSNPDRGFRDCMLAVIYALDAFDAQEQMHVGSGNAQTDCGGEDREPELPEGVTIEGSTYPTYCHGYKSNLYFALWSISELRAIVDHLEWRERQAKPKVTDEMLSAAYRALPPCVSEVVGSVYLRPAIAAALGAQRREA